MSIADAKYTFCDFKQINRSKTKQIDVITPPMYVVGQQQIGPFQQNKLPNNGLLNGSSSFNNFFTRVTNKMDQFTCHDFPQAIVINARAKDSRAEHEVDQNA